MLDYVIIEARRQPQNEIVLTKRIARNQRISVGRTDAADLVLNDDPEISSLHFLVAVGDDECTVTDQNSTNKTWHNGQPITQIRIADGESIRCGKTEIVFRLVALKDDLFSAKHAGKDQHRVETTIDFAKVQAQQVELAPQADGPTAAQPVHAQKPPQPSPARPAPATKPAPLARKPAAPVVSNPGEPVQAVSTDSGDMINWNLFAEAKPDSQQSAEASAAEQVSLRQSNKDMRKPDPPSVGGWVKENCTSEIEKTQLIADRMINGEIVQVAIGIAGHSDPLSRLVIDPLQNSKAVIGRTVSTDFAIPLDPFMSNRHFEIEILGAQCLIRDLSSANGTFLNGQRIVAAPLVHQDRVRAGKTDFEITIESGE